MSEKIVSLDDFKQKARERRDQKEYAAILEMIDIRCEQLNHPPELVRQVREVVGNMCGAEIRPFSFDLKFEFTTPEDRKAVESAMSEISGHATERVEALNALVLRLAIEKVELEHCLAHKPG